MTEQQITPNDPRYKAKLGQIEGALEQRVRREFEDNPPQDDETREIVGMAIGHLDRIRRDAKHYTDPEGEVEKLAEAIAKRLGVKDA